VVDVDVQKVVDVDVQK